MSIVSFYYLAFVALGVGIYYLLPKMGQWVWLLALSLLFYCTSDSYWHLLYLVCSTLVAYAASNFVVYAADKNERVRWLSTFVTGAAIAVNVLIWLVVKGQKFLPGSLSLPELGAAMGMGYYTLQVIGYLLDCAWGNARPQRNPLKLFLFVCFFPQLTTGPISRYSQLETLYEKHRFSYQNLCFGAQRILWGFFKKLVIAERAGLIVNGIWNDLTTYSGFWHWVAMLVYPLQLYADFSGSMDIILGTAEVFGITLPENFQNPFFSRTIQEFWQKWHITLGSWAKDYIMYPLLKSGQMVKFGKYARRKCGKRLGKWLTVAIGTGASWVVIGIWHGESKHLLGVSLWFWSVMMLSELLAPTFKKINRILDIPTETFGWHMVQSVRTYFLFAIGLVFFRADGMSAALSFLKSLPGMFVGETTGVNPWIFFDGSVLTLGVAHTDLNLLIISVMLLLAVGILREKCGFARVWIARQWIVLRWLVWLSMFVIVLIWGQYGPGYDAAEFIYRGF